MTTAAEKVVTTDKGSSPVATADKASEKAAAIGTAAAPEKRRALGRGLESLLGGPRIVGGTAPGGTAPAPAAARAGVSAPHETIELQGVVEASHAGAAVPGDGHANDSQFVGDLQAAASRRPRADQGEEITELPLDAVVENPYQTRRVFDGDLLQELALSIKAHGLIQPIVVRPGQDGKYVLILGERRLRAAKIAGLETIPAIVRRVNNEQAAEMTVVENIQREDLRCMEQAEAFAMLSKEFGLTQEEIGKKTGCSRETVSNYMRLLKLPFQVHQYLNNGELEFSHARELLNLLDPTVVVKIAEQAVKHHMSVIQLEKLVFETNVPLQRQADAIRRGARWVDPNVKAAQRTLEEALGVRVRIRDRKGKGKIVIEYATIEDFDRVVEMLSGGDK